MVVREFPLPFVGVLMHIYKEIEYHLLQMESAQLSGRTRVNRFFELFDT